MMKSYRLTVYTQGYEGLKRIVIDECEPVDGSIIVKDGRVHWYKTKSIYSMYKTYILQHGEYAELTLEVKNG